MPDDLFLNLLYLVLLLLAVMGTLARDLMRSPARSARYALTWGFIFIGLIAGAGLWSETRRALTPAQATLLPNGRIEIQAATDGHYHLTAQLNGKPVHFMIDTGASEIVLSKRDAARIGIAAESLVFTGRASTANGMVRTAPVRIARFELAQGAPAEQDLRAIVSEGEMPASLLGMAYLSRRAKVSFEAGRMVIDY